MAALHEKAILQQPATNIFPKKNTSNRVTDLPDSVLRTWIERLVANTLCGKFQWVRRDADGVLQLFFDEGLLFYLNDYGDGIGFEVQVLENSSKQTGAERFFTKKIGDREPLYAESKELLRLIHASISGELDENKQVIACHINAAIMG